MGHRRGVLLIITPDGSSIQRSNQLLTGGLFKDYLIPG